MRLFPCTQDPAAPQVRLVLTAPMGFTASEADKVRKRLRRASWGCTSFHVRREMKTIECTFDTAGAAEVQRLYNHIHGGLARDFIGPWTYRIEEG